MGKHSHIAWTDHTFNPWWGCSKASPACNHCYAEAWAARFGLHIWGQNAPRHFFGDKHWEEPLRWNAQAQKAGIPARVFCGSMCDVMEDHIELQQIRVERLYPLIENTPQLDWILLTKRPQNFRRFLPKSWLKNPRPNVMGMVTVENEYFTWRITELLRTPFVWRGISLEPLLGPVDISPFVGVKPRKLHPDWCGPKIHPSWHGPTLIRGIDWVIVGGESGPKARPMHPAWVRDLRDKCQKNKTAFFFKQWGEWLPADQFGADGNKPTVANTGAKWGVLNHDGVFFENCTRWMTAPGTYSDDREVYVYRVGRRNAGRLLDGREYMECPLD